MSWPPHEGSFSCSASCFVFHISFAVLRLVLLWLMTSALLRNYHRVRAELYQPAVDLQDYEMVELFLRRLKMWMGLSRTKEVGPCLAQLSASCVSAAFPFHDLKFMNLTVE